MGRALLFATVVLVMTGCAGTTDLAAPRMLPDEHVKMPFAEVVARARAQAGVATEAFLVNDFGRVEDMATGIVQTCHVLANATDVPVKHQDRLKIEAEDLEKEAKKLQSAARAKEPEQMNTAMTGINRMVRELWPGS